MKLWTEFSKRISQLLPGSISPEAAAKLAALNTDRISLENVRSVLGVSTTQARRVCETAVRRGIFRKMIQVYCPDGSVAVVVDSESQVPVTVRCWTDDDDFEMLRTADLRRAEVYAFHG